jgi:hypothetical protein
MRKTKAIIALSISILLVSTMALAIETVTAKQNNIMGQIGEHIEQFANHINQNGGNFSNRLTQASWVRMKGNITEWGSEAVTGVLQTQGRTASRQFTGNNQVSSATAMWTTNTSRAIDSYRAKENFTYTFYVARLTNASVSTMDSNTTTGTYFLNGTWSLQKVISTITVNTNENGTITHVNRNQDITPSTAYGELSIGDNKFELTINGLETLTGTVFRSITRSWYNPFKMGDFDSTTNTVTHTDVRTIARCYGAMPGWGNFDSSMDFNNNYRVDIADISTVAANV